MAAFDALMMGGSAWSRGLAPLLLLLLLSPQQRHLASALQAPAARGPGPAEGLWHWRQGRASRFAELTLTAASDGSSSAIRFTFDGEPQLYRLGRFSAFAPGALPLRHTERGVFEMTEAIPATFRSQVPGRRATVTQHLDGSLFGVFEFNGRFYQLDPLDSVMKANGLFHYSGAERQYTYFKTHRMQVLEAPHIASKILPPGAGGGGAGAAGGRRAPAAELRTRRVSPSDEPLSGVRGELNATGDLPQEPHDNRVPTVIIDYHVPELEIDTRQAQPSENFSGEEWFPGCYDGDVNMHTMEIGVLGDLQMYKEYGENAATMLIEAVITASMVYEGQMHIELVIGHLKIYETAEDAPGFAVGCAETGVYASDSDVGAILSALRQDYEGTDEIPFQASLTLFTGCGPNYGTIGLAYHDQLCQPWGYGVSVVKVREEPHTASTWLTLAHELGHTLGAHHSFEDGVAATGGIMDYGDGTLAGVYQFHEYRREEMCATLSKGLEHCHGKFKQKGVEYVPTPAPTQEVTCQDEPEGYIDLVGDRCGTYAYYLWCTESGGYGPGWDPAWGTFGIYAKDGVSPDQACCACGGGIPTTSSPTRTPTKAPTTSSPTGMPTMSPTTSSPTGMPTLAPTTSSPTGTPTMFPTTSSPTGMPTMSPTTSSPTGMPTMAPTTSSPTGTPTLAPTTFSPTGTPTMPPATLSPTAAPTSPPTPAPHTVAGNLTFGNISFTEIESNNGLRTRVLILSREFFANATHVALDDVTVKLIAGAGPDRRNDGSLLLGFSISIRGGQGEADTVLSTAQSAQTMGDLAQMLCGDPEIGSVGVCPLVVTNVVAEELNAGAAAAAPPAAAAPGPVTAFGDPHLKNVRGETFKVERAGNHTLIVVPAGAGQDDALLHIQGLITYRGPVCGQLYITTLVVAGVGLGDLGRLTFVTRSEEFNTPMTRSLRIGSAAEMSAEDFAAKAVGSKVIKEVRLYDPAEPSSVNRHVTTLMVLLDVQVGRVKVRWEHQKEAQGYSNWLWLDVTGLATAEGRRIGGLLGEDDHELIATPPGECLAPRVGLIGHNKAPAGICTIASATLSDVEIF